MSSFPISHEELLIKLCHVEPNFIYKDNFDNWMFAVTKLTLHRWLEFKHVQYAMWDVVGMLVSVIFCSGLGTCSSSMTEIFDMYGGWPVRGPLAQSRWNYILSTASYCQVRVLDGCHGPKWHCQQLLHMHNVGCMEIRSHFLSGNPNCAWHSIIPLSRTNIKMDNPHVCNSCHLCKWRLSHAHTYRWDGEDHQDCKKFPCAFQYVIDGFGWEEGISVGASCVLEVEHVGQGWYWVVTPDYFCEFWSSFFLFIF